MYDVKYNSFNPASDWMFGASGTQRFASLEAMAEWQDMKREEGTVILISKITKLI